MLRSVKSEASDSVTVNYYFVDPFGSLGAVYIELHKASDLTVSELDDDGNSTGNTVTLKVEQLYDPEEAVVGEVNQYWTDYSNRYGAAYRASINVYDTNYTFTGLEPGERYWVVLATESERADTDDSVVSGDSDLVKTLRDTFLVQTLERENNLIITEITSDAVSVRLNLESRFITSSTVEADNAVLRIEYQESENYPFQKALNASDLNDAVNGGVSWTFNLSSQGRTTSQLGETVKVGLYVPDASNESNLIKTMQVSNPFYNS